MKTVHEIYGLEVSDTRYKSNLKQMLEDYFKNSTVELM